MNPALLLAIRLGKEGFGAPTDILKMPVDVVLAIMEFCNFQRDYDEALVELNRQTPATK